MEWNRVGSVICLLGGIVLVFGGVYMILTGQTSGGYTSGSMGNVQYGTMDGYGVLFVGGGMLATALVCYLSYKNQIKKKKKKKTQLNVKEQNTINRTPCCR